MKRFRDCTINCNTAIDSLRVLNEIEEICKNNCLITERYNMWVANDSLKVTYEKTDLPPAVIILSCIEDENYVKICNIIPSAKNKNQRILLDDYNSILNDFVEEIINKITSVGTDAIIVTSANYELRDLIPFSYEKLSTWLNKFPLSGHQNDEVRWYEFIISIVNHNEQLDSEVLADFFKETQLWDDDIVEELIQKYEFQRDILTYLTKKNK